MIIVGAPRETFRDSQSQGAGHIGANLCKNAPGEFDMKLFSSAVKYFS